VAKTISSSLVTLLFILCLSAPPLLAAPGGGPAAPAGERNILPAKLGNVGIDQHLNAQLPLDLVFHDEAGRDVRLADSFDGQHPVILVLAYFKCPMLCTLVLNDLSRTLKVLPLDMGKDFRVLTVSFDPHETPQLAAEKKKKYVHDYGRPGAAGAWQFLTGDQAAIQALTHAVGFRYHYDAKARQYVHPSGITILTPDGKISKYFFGIDYNPTDVRLALVDASKRRIGGLTDQILLYCFHYDPSTGRYGWAVLKALRIGAVAVMALLGTLLFVMFRRERCAPAAPGPINPPQSPQPPTDMP
jgi:protein SCO1/2